MCEERRGKKDEGVKKQGCLRGRDKWVKKQSIRKEKKEFDAREWEEVFVSVNH